MVGVRFWHLTGESEETTKDLRTTDLCVQI